MRRSFATIVTTIVVSLSVAGGAQASSPGSPGGHGKSGSMSGGSGGSVSGGADASGRDVGVGHSKWGEYDDQKPWYVEGLYEFHHLVRQSDLGGDAPNKNFNFLYAEAGWNFTADDKVYVRAGGYERFIADQGETGFRFDDAIVAYVRHFTLPQEINLRIIPRFTIPLSFESKLQHTITAPRLTLAVDKNVGPATFTALTYGEYYLNSTTAAPNGANPNPRSVLGLLLQAEVAMPFHRPLSFGIEGYAARLTYYNPSQGSLANTGLQSAMGGVQPGTMADPSFGTNQPQQNSYGGEIYARYAFPTWKRIVSDFRAVYANGDSTLGYQSGLHDGVTRVNLFYRHVGELYFALNAHY